MIYLVKTWRFFQKIFGEAKRQDYSVIEPGILPLVECMNASGAIQTIASCHGHNKTLRKPPYVYFKSAVGIAALIEQALRKDSISNHPKLRMYWVVEGRFDENYKLVYILHSPGYQCRFFRLSRKQLDQELQFLTLVVKQAVLPYIRE